MIRTIRHTYIYAKAKIDIFNKILDLSEISYPSLNSENFPLEINAGIKTRDLEINRYLRLAL